jgi:predicted anti-sigma-YlaC factor YlaD
MTTVKKRLLASMRKVMLTCEAASLISTRELVEKIGIMSRMSLQMHLAACKHCRKYYHQTRILSRVIHHQNNVLTKTTAYTHRLSPAEKSNFQRLISNKIQS